MELFVLLLILALQALVTLKLFFFPALAEALQRPVEPADSTTTDPKDAQ